LIDCHHVRPNFAQNGKMVPLKLLWPTEHGRMFLKSLRREGWNGCNHPFREGPARRFHLPAEAQWDCQPAAVVHHHHPAKWQTAPHLPHQLEPFFQALLSGIPHRPPKHKAYRRFAFFFLALFHSHYTTGNPPSSLLLLPLANASFDPPVFSLKQLLDTARHTLGLATPPR
jgi:hypothetical protein